MIIIRQLGSGKYSDCFKVIDAATPPCAPIAMKLSYYQEATLRASTCASRRGDMHAACAAKDQDAISVAMAMADVAKELKKENISPHFVTVYCEADIRYLPRKLHALLGNRMPTLSKRQVKYSHVCLMQLYMCNLTSFVAWNPCDKVIRSFVFQVVYTLACLQLLFPGFRHNDLTTNNVLIKRTVKPGHALSQARTRYTIGSASYYLPDTGYVAVLADFDFTHVPGHALLSNERVLSGKYNIDQHPNAAYDPHLFMHSLWCCLRKNAPQAKRYAPHTLAFLKSLGLDMAHARLTRPVTHVSPLRILEHPYFAVYRGLRGVTVREAPRYSIPLS